MKTKIIALVILALLTACSKEPTVTDKKVVTANPATSITQTNFTANWSALAGATGYFLDVATDEAFDSFVSGFDNLPVASTSASVTGLTAGTTYYYRVRATTAGGTTENSLTVTVYLNRYRARFFGDSITKGLRASDSTKRWTSLLCGLRNWDESNYGTSYESLLKASEIIGTHFFEKYQKLIVTRLPEDKYIFISYGGADCLFNFPDYTPDLFSTQLQTIITFANSKGWTNDSIVVLCGYYQDDYSWGTNYLGVTLPSAATMDRYYSFIAAAQTVAGNNVGVQFVNPFDSYDRETGMNDELHPNDKGYAAIAAYVNSKIN